MLFLLIFTSCLDLITYLIVQRMFREMVPGMVNVLEQCLAESDEENAGKGFEVFDTLLMLVSANL
jgi:hypothetical protein